MHRGKGCKLISFFLFFTVEGEGGGGQCFFSPKYMKRWKEEGGKGYIGFFWKCFFHCGEGREGKGV